MEMYLITGGSEDPRLRWTLREAQQALREQYDRGHLEFEQEPLADRWLAYDWGNTDENDRAPVIPERIVKVLVPGTPRGAHLPDGVGVRMEMRITTRESVVSMESAEADETWTTMLTSRGFLIEQFAARAGRALADHLTKGDPR